LFHSTIYTDRLKIRPFTSRDVDRFFEIIDNEDIVQYLPDKDLTKGDIENIVSWFIKCYDENTPNNITKYTLALEERTTASLIGWGGFGPLDFDPKTIELYFGIERSHWNKGFGTEAAKAIVEFAFTVVELPQIVAVVKPENIASVRIIRKLRMSRIKTISGLPEEFSFYNGEDYYLMKRSDYLNNRSSYQSTFRIDIS